MVGYFVTSDNVASRIIGERRDIGAYRYCANSEAAYSKSACISSASTSGA